MRSGPFEFVRSQAWTVALAASVLTLLLVPATGAALERVQDGGFEAATCTPTACQSDVWSASSERNATADLPTVIGPICSGATYGCAAGTGGYVSAPHWARLGAGAGMTGDPCCNLVISRIEQSVLIPAAPATLRFAVRTPPSGAGSTSFTIFISGTPIYYDTVATGDSYRPIELDVSQFAGGPRMLRFEAESIAFETLSRTWEIDDVSLDAPNPPVAPQAPAATGQRAAALKKCKKKRRKARSKCKKKANLLPV